MTGRSVPVPVAAADAVIRRCGRALWAGLPAFALAGALLSAAVVLAVVAAPGVNAVSLLVGALAAGAPLAALAHLAHAAAADGDVTVRGWWRALRTHAGFGVRHALVVVAPAVVFVAALQWWSAAGHPPWLLPSVSLSGAATVVAVLGGLAVFPLGTGRPTLRGRRLWVTALWLVARRPSRFVAVVCLAGLGLWAGIGLTASVLVLLPAPVVLLAAAAVWTTVTETVGAEKAPTAA